jgi:multidrug resistance efflux pump
MDSSKQASKSRRNFWVVFVLLILLAAIANIGNLHEYNKMNELNTEGRRIKCAVDSVVKIGAKTEVHARFVVNGKIYEVSQKIKSMVHKGDSVAVYYLEQDPETNGVPDE